MKSPTRTTRIIYLDYLKAIAIFMVIIYHSHAYSGVFMPALLSMCVTIFFAINGYLMLVKKRSYQDLLRKDLKIVFLVVFWGLLRAAFQTWILGREMSAIDIFQNFSAMKPGYGHYLWFLVAIALLNLVNPLLHDFIQHNTRKEKAIFLFLIFIFTPNYINLLTWKFNPLINWYHHESLFYYVFGFFVIGYAGRIKWPLWKTALLFAAFVMAQTTWNYLSQLPRFEFMKNGSMVFGNYGSVFVMGETMTLILLMSKARLKSNRFIEYVGKRTLGIYLLQDFFCSIAVNVLPQQYAYAYPLLVLMACLAVLWLFDQVKPLKWLVEM